jgi:hypothetical protein
VAAAAHAITPKASSIVAARNATKNAADLRGEFIDPSSLLSALYPLPLY